MIIVWLLITIGVTVIIGFPLIVFFAWITYFEPIEDIKTAGAWLLKMLRKRSWEDS